MKIYAYTTSQNDVVYVRDDGDLILIADVDESKLIEIGMEATGAEVIQLEVERSAIEHGFAPEELAAIEDATSDVLRQRIVVQAEIEED